MQFDHWVEWRHAYDCVLEQPCKMGSDRCIPGGGGSHGRGSVLMYFYTAVKDAHELGVVQFAVNTGWYIDATQEMIDSKPSKPWTLQCGYWHWNAPQANDLGYHSPYPQYEDQWVRHDCTLLNENEGGTCYYDGSSLQADEPFRIMREEGDKAFKAYMENHWRYFFEDGDKGIKPTTDTEGN